MARVMLVGIQKRDAESLKKIFGSVRVLCEEVPSYDEAFNRISNDPPSLVVAAKPDFTEALYSLNSCLLTNAPATPFLVSLPEPKSQIALEAMRAGAYDCIAKPFTRLDVLATAKRATWRKGRSLFVQKVKPRRKNWIPILLGILLGFVGFKLLWAQLNGPPAPRISLSSVHLSGIQWQDRSLWVSDWFASTITEYELKRGITGPTRGLRTKSLFHMQEGQPILICNTRHALITIGNDLKIRSHHRDVGLPSIQAMDTPGSAPAGMAWDGDFLWTADTLTGQLYRHGVDLRVHENVKSLVPLPIGLAWDGDSIWVVGRDPLQLARMQIVGRGYVWHGPYRVELGLLEGITPSGLAVGFDRLWMVSSGDPMMLSIPLSEIRKGLVPREKRLKREEKREKKEKEEKKGES